MRRYVLLTFFFFMARLLSACDAMSDETSSSFPMIQEIDIYSVPPLWVEVTGSAFEVGRVVVLNILYIAPAFTPQAYLAVELPPQLAFAKVIPAWRGALHAGERKLFRVPLKILSLPLTDVVRVTISSGENSVTVEWSPTPTP